MIRLNIEQIAEAVKGKLIYGKGSEEIQGISIDSRQVSPGDLFFCLIGENHDSHTFIDQVLARGCRGLIVSRPVDLSAFGKETEAVDVILVEDTEKALQELSRYYLSLCKVKKVAVTGSTGKTTTKEMLYWILSEKYKTARTLGNFNNHIGLPLTAFTLDETTEAAVFEMGMSEFGEIDLLADLVRPDVALITNIGTSHMESLGSRENILKAKMEITNYFDPSQCLVVNEDLDFLSRENMEGNYRLVTVGATGRSQFILSGIEDRGAEGISFSLEHQGKMKQFRLSIPGRHNAYNGALAVAAASCLGISLEQAANGLAKMEEITDKRLSIKGKNGIRVIDDTYNASPDSMKAALDVLVSSRGVRKIAILGDMFELGDQERGFHEEVGRYAGKCRLDLLIAVGERAKAIAAGGEVLLGKENTLHYTTKELLIKDIGSIISSGDVVLIKGSRGMEMDQIVKKIME